MTECIGEDERLLQCVNPRFLETAGPIEGYCPQCHEIPYRIVVLESSTQKQRSVGLCGRHFSAVRTKHPEWHSVLV
jgi:hypothetical protein